MNPNRLSGKIQTVLGPIEPEELGITLMHEHLLLDLTCYFRVAPEASLRAYADAPVTIDMLGGMPALFKYSRNNQRFLDVDTAIEEVSLYRHAGGNSLVDTTSMTIARDPLGLARISRATGLNIVMGGSYYVTFSYPPDMDQKTEEEIASEIIRDITVGVGETGVRSGIIGEVGNFWPLTDNERKVLRASARAQVETGAPITIHPGAHSDAHHEIIEVLASAGADPRRVVMGHLEFTLADCDALERLADTGCFLEYDTFGWDDSSLQIEQPEISFSNDVQRMQAIEFLIEQGRLGQIVVAQDICQQWMLTRNGGKGYAHVLNNIVPRMRKRGFTQGQIQAILVDNPRRALTFDRG